MEDQFADLLSANAVLTQSESGLDGRLRMDLRRVKLQHVTRRAPLLAELFDRCRIEPWIGPGL